MYTCTTPSGLLPPTLVSTTSTSIILSWTEPISNGGCPITGYALFRDDGITKNPTIEVNTANDPAIRGIPTLR